MTTSTTSRHAHSSSHGSACSLRSSPFNSPLAVSTRRTTPAPSPIRTHGPLLLPKIRTQDQALSPGTTGASPTRAYPYPSTSSGGGKRGSGRAQWGHARSFTNPTISSSEVVIPDRGAEVCSHRFPSLSFVPGPDNPAAHLRRASTCSLESLSFVQYGFPAYGHMPAYASVAGPGTSVPLCPQLRPQPGIPGAATYQEYAHREPSPLVQPSVTPDPYPSTTLMAYLTSPSPAPALVRAISFSGRDPHTRHFWWDVRQVRPWSSFNASTIQTLPCAAALVCPIPETMLPMPAAAQRHPETEAALHSMYASYYLPRLNAALALSSARPLQLSVPQMRTSAAARGMATDCMFVANATGEPASAALMFGGKQTARVVGLVKSFDRFNTGMRVGGNIKRVEYLRGLAHLHHAMREHACRYGFILTEIELVVVRNGGDTVPHFGYLEVAHVQLAAAHERKSECADRQRAPLTASLALWALCAVAGDERVPGHAHWHSEIGAPAEGTRHKALPRDGWLPQPQLAEKREAKRTRGWVWPEDPVGRKELGKRGVRYGRC